VSDAHGNRDFCVDGVNCLIPEASVGAVSDAIARLLADPGAARAAKIAARWLTSNAEAPNESDNRTFTVLESVAPG
jgi:hypothetical protein